MASRTLPGNFGTGYSLLGRILLGALSLTAGSALDSGFAIDASARCYLLPTR